MVRSVILRNSAVKKQNLKISSWVSQNCEFWTGVSGRELKGSERILKGLNETVRIWDCEPKFRGTVTDNEPTEKI